MKLQERTLQSKLRYWASVDRAGAGSAPTSLLDEAADRLDEAQTLAEERLVSIGHWKAANEEAQRERDDALVAVAQAKHERLIVELDLEAERLDPGHLSRVNSELRAENARLQSHVPGLTATLDETRSALRRLIAAATALTSWDWPRLLIDGADSEVAIGDAEFLEEQLPGARIALAAVVEPAPFGHLSRANPDDEETMTNESALAEIMRAGKERLKTIAANREAYVAAFIAETGLAPSECEIVERAQPDGSLVVSCRKREAAGECVYCRAVEYRVSGQCHIHGTTRETP